MMCAIVRGVLHVSHKGGGSLVIRYECVIWEWPILDLFITICSLLDAFSGYAHLDIDFFMFLSLLLEGIESQ